MALRGGGGGGGSLSFALGGGRGGGFRGRAIQVFPSYKNL